MPTVMYWFRKDLRLTGNPAWSAACKAGHVFPVFISEPELISAAGKERLIQLYENLESLHQELAQLGGALHLLQGPAEKVIPRLISELDVAKIFVNSDVSPFSTKRDTTLEQKINIPIQKHWGNLMHPPGSVLTQKGTLSKAFTPFYKKWNQMPLAEMPAFTSPEFIRVEKLFWEKPNITSSHGLNSGSAGAKTRLDDFLSRSERYEELRNFPGKSGTSMLSSDLHFGTIGPLEIINRAKSDSHSQQMFIRQLAWRDWYAHLLFATPEIIFKSANPIYEKIQWENNLLDFDLWKNGKTGYPIVDAGMRELRATGFMHNRVRMITASFLIKDLLIDWRLGEKYFRRHLIDGDIAQNVGNWQWVAGTGFDAAPYFRVFNPVLQSKKFDPAGEYIRAWVPEIGSLQNDQIHSPWTMTKNDLLIHGITLGTTYPLPLVDHAEARDRSLKAYKKVREI
ncbi:MAG: deoxyribodipyrimidine photo-lyase [Acidimicrobiales bacterium]|nr:deoxyribodipyrimidine photo-lyase [Acidimicrobiales bacterium]